MPKKSAKPTARQDRGTNARQKGENHRRDERLDAHDDTLGDHDETLTTHDGKLDTQKGRLDGHDKDVSDIRKGDTFNPNAIKGGPLGSLSHTQNAEGQPKDPLGAANKTQDAQRAVATPGHMATEILRPYHAPDDTWEPRHVKGLIPNNKLAQDFSVFARSDNTYNRAANDQRFLKSDKHPDFTTGHWNDHHSTAAAAKNHTHSLSVKDLPLDALREMRRVRNSLRVRRDELLQVAGRTAQEENELTQLEGTLHVQHLLYDSPQMSLEAMLEAMEDDPRYRDIAALQQTHPSLTESHYFTDRGPDVAASGVYGTEASGTWYPPIPIELKDGPEVSISGNGRTFDYTADFSGLGEGDVALFAVGGHVEFNHVVSPAGFSEIGSQPLTTAGVNIFVVVGTVPAEGIGEVVLGVVQDDGIPDPLGPHIVTALVVKNSESSSDMYLRQNSGGGVDISSNFPRRGVPEGLLLESVYLDGDGYEIHNPKTALFKTVLRNGNTFALFSGRVGSSDPIQRKDLTVTPENETWATGSVMFSPRHMTIDEALVAAGYEEA